MAKKKKSRRSVLPRPLSDVWSAGVGALSSARALGADGFDALLTRGRALAEDGEQAARSALSDVERAASSATDKAVGTVQDGIEATVERVLGALGLPGRNEVVELQAQVEALQHQIGELRRERAASATRATPAASADAPAAKRAAPKRAAAKTSASPPARSARSAPKAAQAPSGASAPRAASPASADVPAFTVAPHPDGWAVRREGAERALSVFATKKEATLAGRQAAKAAAPSRLTLHRVDDTPGEVIDYAPPDAD